MRHAKKRTVIKTVLSILFIIILAIGGIAGYEYYKINEATNKMAEGQNSSKEIKNTKKGKPITILLMGLDNGALNRKAGVGNTDTLEVLTVNPHKKAITMTSIPRDTLIKINTPKGADYVKINAAYSMGGPKATESQVEKLLNIKIDYYVTVNMGVLINVVNNLNGITVDNPFEFTYKQHTFPQGKQHLNGKNTLTYSRMRDEDPRGDYGRQQRQQQVMQAIIKKVKNEKSLTTLNKILDSTSKNIKTDMPITDLTDLYFGYHQAMQKTKTYHLQGKGATIDESSIQIATPYQMNKLSKIINTAVGRKYTKVNNIQAQMYNNQTTYNGVTDVNFVLPDGASYNDPGSGHPGQDKLNHDKQIRQNQLNSFSKSLDSK